MSTTIDSDIIKALVEHIGMDPDSVGGGSGSGGSGVINVEWSTVQEGKYNLLAFTLPEGVKLQMGTCLKLVGINGWTEDNRSYCSRVAAHTSDYYTFSGDKGISFFYKDGKWVANEYAVGVNIASLPDNKTTGFFTPSSIDFLPSLAKVIFENIDRVKNQMYHYHSET